MQKDRIESVAELMNRLIIIYNNWSGMVVVKLFQYVFCNLLQDQKWCFDLVNTLMFVMCLFMCGKLITKRNLIAVTFVFALFFWFLCPIPRETLFWAVGSTVYLWSNVLVFAYLVLYLSFKDKNSPIVFKIGMFFFSIVSACNIIPCVSICGAFVVYYLFHIKQLKGNAVPLVVGFVIGSLAGLCAPGNFARMAVYGSISFFDKINDLMRHPVREIIKYKALWLLVLVLIYGFRNRKPVMKKWLKDNEILIITLGWSIIAFSVVFRPDVRALSFTETLSIVLMMKFIIDTKESTSLSKYVVLCGEVGLFMLLIVDAFCAVKETKVQRDNNVRLLAEIADSNGVIALDVPSSKHRMAYAPFYPSWTWETLADKMKLDSVHVYPFFCQDKYFINSSLGENVYVDEGGKIGYGYDPMIIIRMPYPDMEGLHHYSFSITYLRPKKWYKSWLDNIRDYQYERTIEVESGSPEECFDGFEYFIVWFKKDNAKNIKKVTISQI